MKRLTTLALACVAALAVAIPAVAATKTAVPNPSGLDKEYLQTSMRGDLFEIQGGKIALKKSHNSAVRALAKRLISDHTKSYKDTAKLAREEGVKVETSPTPSEQWELRVVQSFAHRAFNDWYTSLEVYDHHQDIQETTDEIQDGSAKPVRDDARQELPMLKMHLKMSEAALKAS